jgi:hypothetical protein
MLKTPNKGDHDRSAGIALSYTEYPPIYEWSHSQRASLHRRRIPTTGTAWLSDRAFSHRIKCRNASNADLRTFRNTGASAGPYQAITKELARDLDGMVRQGHKTHPSSFLEDAERKQDGRV